MTIRPAPADGPERLAWLDAFDDAIWHSTRRTRHHLMTLGVPPAEVQILLNTSAEDFAKRIAGAIDAERLDWALEESA